MTTTPTPDNVRQVPPRGVPTDPTGGEGPRPPEAETPSRIAEAVALAMANAWSRGERPVAEDFLERHPEVSGDPQAAARVIYEEICLRESLGQGPDREDLVRRFPRWEDEIRILLDCHRMMRSTPSPPTGLPELGETLGEYTVRAVLGGSERGRVFLATQGSLADRPVVLKVTKRRGREHLALARLQHPHIVSLFACHEFPERDLRALCMPYLGGATLDRVLDRLQGRDQDSLSGNDLLQVLDESRTAYISQPAWSVVRHFLARAAFTRAVCWVGACVAEALHYAHDQGVVHLDLKPSNILLADDGQPMLLDFHLARGPLAPDGEPPEYLGGTPGYMSPEQEWAIEAVRVGAPIPVAVDGRSDVFSLGVVLYEILAGASPSPAGPGSVAGTLLQANPRVTLGLAEIVARCLAVDPSHRHRDAGSLAAELRRHLGTFPFSSPARRGRLLPRWLRPRQ